MTSSAVFHFVVGLGLSFFPDEPVKQLSAWTGTATTDESAVWQLILQLTGGLYFGFGMLNWMARHSVIGGIYNKPIVMANLALFLIGGLALLKASLQVSNLPPVIYLLTIIYLFFMAVFALISFRHPGKPV